LTRLFRRLFLLGAAAGIWATFLAETAARLMLRLEAGANLAPVTCVVSGMALGASIAPLGEMLNRYPARSIKAALTGLILGGLAALLGSLVYSSVYQAQTTPDITSHLILGGVHLALVAMAIGFSAGFAAGGPSQAVAKMAAGLFMGVVIGLPLLGLQWILPQGPWVVTAGMGLWGGALAVSLFWWERRSARRWLRLLSYPGEDTIFPLAKPVVTLGKEEQNDIPLTGFKEIYPFHCQFKLVDGQYEVADEDQGGLVMVNYRQAQAQALKPGDLVKIGTALLQYGEVQR